MAVDPFHTLVTTVMLAVAADRAFALAGAGALNAHGIVDRPTQDIDLFSPLPGGPGAAFDDIRAALVAAGFVVTVTRPLGTGGDFVAFTVARDGQSVSVDLARDWRSADPVRLAVGPVLAAADLVGSKATALATRGLARDFIDTAAILDRFSRIELLRLTFERDPGLRVRDFADAMKRLDTIDDAAFAAYDLTVDQIAAVRERFVDWPRDPAGDDEGHAAHRAAHPPGEA